MDDQRKQESTVTQKLGIEMAKSGIVVFKCSVVVGPAACREHIPAVQVFASEFPEQTGTVDKLLFVL